MNRKNRNSIASCLKLPQFITMNVIDGQAGLVRYYSLIFYSLTINNILNIIILVILTSVTIVAITGNDGILKKALLAKNRYKNSQGEENKTLNEYENGIDNYLGSIKGSRNEFYNIKINDENLKGWLASYSGKDELTLHDFINNGILSKLLENEDSVNYMINNEEIMNEMVNSESGMTALGNSSLAGSKLMDNNNWYTAIINSSYISQFDKGSSRNPAMTSDSGPKGKIYASSESLAVWLAFDKKSDSSSARSAWAANQYESNAWLAYEFEEPVSIYKFTLENLMDGWTFYINTFSLYGSEDGNTYEKVYDGNGKSGNCAVSTYTIPTRIKKYKYYKLLITSNHGDWTGIGELEFYYR